MVVSVDYTKAIEELGSQLKDALVSNAILKAQLDAITKELNNVLEQNTQNNYSDVYQNDESVEIVEE